MSERFVPKAKITCMPPNVDWMQLLFARQVTLRGMFAGGTEQSPILKP